MSAGETVVVTFPAFVADDRAHAGALDDAGLSVRLAPKVGARTSAELAELIADAVGAIVSTDPFDRSVFLACPRLRVVARVGVGVDSIDLDAATEAGVVVTTTPGANIESVADHTLALALAALRRVVESDTSVRRGQWRRSHRICPGSCTVQRSASSGSVRSAAPSPVASGGSTARCSPTTSSRESLTVSKQSRSRSCSGGRTCSPFTYRWTTPRRC